MKIFYTRKVKDFRKSSEDKTRTQKGIPEQKQTMLAEGCFFTCFIHPSDPTRVILKEKSKTRSSETRHIQKVVQYLTSIEALNMFLPRYYEFDVKKGQIVVERLNPINPEIPFCPDNAWISVLFQALYIAQLLTHYKINHNDLKLDNFLYRTEDVILSYDIDNLKFSVPTFGYRLFVTDFNFTEVYAENNKISRNFNIKAYKHPSQTKDFRNRVGITSGWNRGFNTFQVISSFFDYLECQKKYNDLQLLANQTGVSLEYVFRHSILHRDPDHLYTDRNFSDIFKIDLFKPFQVEQETPYTSS